MPWVVSCSVTVNNELTMNTVAWELRRLLLLIVDGVVPVFEL